MRFNLPSGAAAVLNDGILNVGGVGVEESVARVWILVLGLKKRSYCEQQQFYLSLYHSSYSTLIHR